VKLLFLLLIAGGVHAETRLYTDALGLPAGSSYQIGNTTFYTNSLNLPAGTRVDLGSAYLYNDSLGLPAGSSYIVGPSPLGSKSTYVSPWDTKGSGNGKF
jgi:hypothetical protein